MNEREDVIRTREMIMEAVRSAVAERGDLMELAQMREAFRACQDKLAAMEHKIADLEQLTMVYQELSQRRGEQSERLQAEIAGLTATVALLQSSLSNQGDGHG